LKEKTENINKKLSLLNSQREYLKSEVTRLDGEILLENQENINYLYEVDKYSPRAPIQ
jgi:chaperonin cofactor prefoldin